MDQLLPQVSSASPELPHTITDLTPTSVAHSSVSGLQNMGSPLHHDYKMVIYSYSQTCMKYASEISPFELHFDCVSDCSLHRLHLHYLLYYVCQGDRIKEAGNKQKSWRLHPSGPRKPALHIPPSGGREGNKNGGKKIFKNKHLKVRKCMSHPGGFFYLKNCNIWHILSN